MIRLYTNEKKLIDKAARGDRKAQKHIYDQHAPKMLSVCRQYISPIETAEELMLNGFFKVFTKLDQFTHAGSFQGWIRRVMVRECLDHLRKKNPFQFPDEINEQHLPDPVDDDHDQLISLAAIQEIIDRLPTGYKSVFVMYAIDGYKHKEIAQELGISENTSKTQYRKARILLQEQIHFLKQQQQQHEA